MLAYLPTDMRKTIKGLKLTTYPIESSGGRQLINKKKMFLLVGLINHKILLSVTNLT